MNNKWFLCIGLTLILLLTSAACGGSEQKTSVDVQSEQTAAEWSKEGYFEDENGNFLSITLSELDGIKGWYVGCTIGDDSYGNVLPEEDGKLHGNLLADYEEGEFIVTVSEDDEDGLLLEVEEGETYHFSAVDTSGYEAGISVTFNTEGLGYVAVAEKDEELPSEEEFVDNSVQVNLTEPETRLIGAKADDGWEFVKWTKDGEDFSNDQQLTLELTESAVYVAVFEITEE